MFFIEKGEIFLGSVGVTIHGFVGSSFGVLGECFWFVVVGWCFVFYWFPWLYMGEHT